MRSDQDCDDNGDLTRLVCRDTQGAIVIDLAVGVGVGNREHACSQHKGDTANSEDRHPGKPRAPFCRYKTHVSKDYSRKTTSAAKSRWWPPAIHIGMSGGLLIEISRGLMSISQL